MKKTNKTIITLLVITILTIITGALFWMYHEEVNTLKHETQRWAVIEDLNGDRIAIETESNELWDELTAFQNNKIERFFGSNIEEYNNKWGFRYNPENLEIREFAVEEKQTTIERVNKNITYWMSLDRVYIRATITQIHGEFVGKSDDLTYLLFEANLNFSALLIAVIGILISLFVKAEHPKWKKTFKVLLLLFFSVFLLSISGCFISFFYIVEGFNLAPVFLSKIVVSLFYFELILLCLAGLLFLKVII
ncbi:MAG: hypothetical protein D4S01_00660 [Dehalococcoidia bacterium]|nr:MAG: hypothetical protein D4S01_00660 [Dehalococcoidia bacterium]